MVADVLRNVLFFMYLTWGEALALKFLDREILVPELMTDATRLSQGLVSEQLHRFDKHCLLAFEWGTMCCCR